MGIVELATILGAGVLTAVLAVVAWWLGPLPEGVTASRARFPLVPAVAAGLGLVAAPAIGWGVGPWVVHGVAASVPGTLVVTGPTDEPVARAWAAVLITAWLGAPCVGALLGLLPSHGRSARAMAVGAVVIGLGFTATALLLLLALVPLVSMIAAATPIDPSGPAPSIPLVGVIRTIVLAELGAGLSGACAGAIAVTAASSRRGLGIALMATAALPLLAAVVGAVTTPPDVMSQLIMAALTGAVWLVGLGAGAAVRVTRSPR